jgi:hypothetical protein
MTAPKSKSSLLTLVALTMATHFSWAQGDTLRDDLVSYWPLDEIEGNKTPDLRSGFDFIVQNLSASDQIPGEIRKRFQLQEGQQSPPRQESRSCR